MRYSEEEIEEILKKVMSSEKASDELKKQAGKLVKAVKAMELLSFRNTIIIGLVFSAVLSLALTYEKYEIAGAATIIFLAVLIIPIWMIMYRCAKIKTALSKQAGSSSD